MASPADSKVDEQPMSPASLRSLVLTLWRSWATRSLAIGALATGLDIFVGLACVRILAFTFGSGAFETPMGLPVENERVSAMAGVAVGATFTFFANRSFAFRAHSPKLASSALRFAGATVLCMLVHGQVVVLLRPYFAQWLGTPEGAFVIAKMLADLSVFTFGQLLLLRYLVFPKPAQRVVEPPREHPGPAAHRFDEPAASEPSFEVPLSGSVADRLGARARAS